MIKIDLTVTIANLSLLISAIVFIYTLIKDKKLKNQKYADKVRIAAGTTIAKLDRWKKLSLRYFKDIEPLITKTDIEMVKTKDIYHVRDYFWMSLDELWVATYQRIINEQIELAYTDLYSYDMEIGDLFNIVINELRLIDEEMHARLRMLTQNVILETPENVESSVLGNALRELCGQQAKYYEEQMNLIIDPFREEFKKLVVEKEDDNIINKKVEIDKSVNVLNKYLKSKTKQKISMDKEITLIIPEYEE